MQDGDRAMLGVHRAKEGQRDGVVAADDDQAVGAAAQVQRAGLDLGDGGGDVERIRDQVARVGDLLCTEREHILRGVVGPQQPRGLSHVRGTESRARPVAHPAVERDADDRDVRAFHLVEPGQAREGRDAGEPRHDTGVDRTARPLRAHRRSRFAFALREERVAY